MGRREEDTKMGKEEGRIGDGWRREEGGIEGGEIRG